MKPVIALVGRPNVGKSTLFNRITKSRDAIVADFAGLTRDRHYGDAKHFGRELIVVDTGGFEPEKPTGIVAATLVVAACSGSDSSTATDASSAGTSAASTTDGSTLARMPFTSRAAPGTGAALEPEPGGGAVVDGVADGAVTG